MTSRPRKRLDRLGVDGRTPREREVLELMAEGRSNASIAASLVVTNGVVEIQVASILAPSAVQVEADNRRVLAVLGFLGALAD